jgi:hypothetical protein
MLHRRRMSAPKSISSVITVTLASLLMACTGASTGVVVAPSDPEARTTIAPTTAPVSAPAAGTERTLLHGEALAAGTRYVADAQLQDIVLAFTAPSAPLYAQASRRFVGMSTDPAGENLVLAVFANAGLRVFPSPAVEHADLDRDAFGAVTEEAPADVVAWLADRPFLDTTPIEEHVEVGDLAGRGFTYQVGQLPPGSWACGPAPAPQCAATLWAAGRSFHLAAGEAGRIVELDVAGQPMLVIARDEPGVAELVSTLTFDVTPVPAAAGDAVRLPYFTHSLEPGVDYFVDKLSRGVGLLLGAPAGDPLAASQRPDVAWLGYPDQPAALRHYVFTAMDASNVVGNVDQSLNPYALVRPGGIVTWELERFLAHTVPLPDDPIRWLTEQAYVVVERGAHDGEVAGHPARIADVRAARLVDGLTCPDGVGSCVMPFAHGPDAFPIVLSSEYVTRVAEVTIGDRRLLLAADLGTPGESVLKTLRAFQLPTA